MHIVEKIAEFIDWLPTVFGHLKIQQKGSREDLFVHP